MLFGRRKSKMITPGKALPGRDRPAFVVPAQHAVFGTPIRPPFPDGLRTAVFAWAGSPTRVAGSSSGGALLGVRSRGCLGCRYYAWCDDREERAVEHYLDPTEAIREEIPVGRLLDAVAQFPTYSGAYLEALERLDL